ncbi:MAG: hypothetical protein LBS64_05935 [Spirochaetaceae bacterium]|jgi:hypothetical protein|nr:hypothetical protein [Spirochaetaceae bacterium]
MTLGIILVCVNAALWVFFFARFSRRFSPEAMLQDLREEVDKLILENNRTTDRNVTLIEARIRELQALIEEADRRTPRFAAPPPQPTVMAEYFSAGLPMGGADSVKPPDTRVEPPQEKSVRDRVAEYAAAGMSPERIAYELSVSLTEVQIYLSVV